MFGKKKAFTPQPNVAGTGTMPRTGRTYSQQPHLNRQLPTLNQSQTSDPMYPPIGGYYNTLERVNVKEPAKTFASNLFIAHRRVQGSVSPEDMTPDIMGPYSQGGMGGYIR
jgi:hypothetical protein